MRSSAKHGGAESNRGISGHVLTLHQRLYNSLNLGSRQNTGKWHCSDIEIQKNVVRSIDMFLDGISSETLQHPLIKDSVADIIKALESILDFKSQPIMRLATNVAVKMVDILPSSMLHSNVLDIISPLANLLSSQQPQVAMSCAVALNFIISKLSSKKGSKVLQILKATNAVPCIVHNINGFCFHEKSIQYFQEMYSILSKILWQWPLFRFYVWNDSTFLNKLDAMKLMSENSAKVAILQLYSSLALCRNGAEKLLESGEPFLRMMVGCMDRSNTPLVQMEAFKLARCFGLSGSLCNKMMNIYGEPLIEAVVSTIRNWNSLSEQLAKSQIIVVMEVIHLAFITRWAGDHHKYFWKSGVDRILLDLILGNDHKIHQLQLKLSMNELVMVMREYLNSNFRKSFRPYAWDILGGLAANCAENQFREIHGKELNLNALIMCTCLDFIDSIGRLSCPVKTCTGESAARAILMIIHSPCKHIASIARSLLCKLLESSDKHYLGHLLNTLKLRVSANELGIPANLETLMSLMNLACHSGLPKCRELIIECGGIGTMVAFIRWWLNNPVRFKRTSMIPHYFDPLSQRICCFPCTEEWEGEETLLFFSLWILAELLSHSAPKKIHSSIHQADFAADQFVQELQEVCYSCTSSPGSRCYASYILRYFGLYGFPSKLGKRIGKALGDNEHTDLKFDLANREGVYVHEVILMVRCPALLPRELVRGEKSSSVSDVECDLIKNPSNSVRLSSSVDHQSLLKLLEFAYCGYLQPTEEQIKKLKILAKHCNLESLLKMLCRTVPKWGTPVPRFDLSSALQPDGHHFSNLLLEADTTQLVHWKCKYCSALVPHIHCHKIILASSCDYLRALFRSGMQESHLQSIKVPVSWESLNKIVIWFYSGQLPAPSFDCLWNNLDSGEKFLAVRSYLEICWLAEFWLIKDLYEECYEVVVSCLNSFAYLPAKTIQIAADFSQWKLAQVAANSLAPSYHHLRNSGEFDDLDSNLVEMIRAESVRLSQDGSR